MKVQFLVRHGQSGWDDVKLADRDRPLTDKGKRDATKMAIGWSSPKLRST